LERLAAAAKAAGLPEPEIMQSSGGLMSAAAAARHAAWTVLSGPAAGAVAAAYLGSLSGFEDVLSFDMGGTSCDVGVVDGGRVGLERTAAAAAIVRVADHEMLRALRLVTVERGIDPRRYALVAFGGAGPMHAARIAQELGVSRVLCPRAAGVLSALGLVVSDS